MNIFKKSLLTLILLVLSFILGISSVVMFVIKETEKEKRIAVEERLIKMVETRNRIEKEMMDAMSKKAEMADRLSQLQDTIDSLTDKIETIKKKKESALKEFEQVKLQTEYLRNQVNEERKDKEVLVEKLQVEQENVRKLKAEIKGLKDKLAVQTRYLQQTLTRKPVFNKPLNTANSNERSKEITVKEKPDIKKAGKSNIKTKETVKTVKKALKGQILVTNEKFNFVVIDLGANKEIKNGFVFNVVRDNKVIGKIRTERVYEKMSSAAILTESVLKTFKVGDEVLLYE